MIQLELLKIIICWVESIWIKWERVQVWWCISSNSEFWILASQSQNLQLLVEQRSLSPGDSVSLTVLTMLTVTPGILRPTHGQIVVVIILPQTSQHLNHRKSKGFNGVHGAWSIQGDAGYTFKSSSVYLLAWVTFTGPVRWSITPLQYFLARRRVVFEPRISKIRSRSKSSISAPGCVWKRLKNIEIYIEIPASTCLWLVWSTGQQSLVTYTCNHFFNCCHPKDLVNH